MKSPPTAWHQNDWAKKFQGEEAHALTILECITTKGYQTNLFFKV